MRQNQVTIGGEYQVRIGSRLATVRVLCRRERRNGGRAQTVFEVVTADTGRTITATAGRLRPMPGSPDERRVAEAARLDRERRADAAAMRQANDAAGILSRAASSCGWPSGAALGEHLDAWVARLPGAGAQADAMAAVLRALDSDACLPRDWSWEAIASIGRQASAGAPFARPAGHPGAGLQRVNRERLVEMPAGANLAILRQIVNRCHVAEGLLAVAREVSRRMGRHGTRRLPVPLRRGLWQAAAAMHAENRAEYRAVMGHAPLPSERMVAEAVGIACGLGPMPR